MYGNIQLLLGTCERGVDKLLESADGQRDQSGILCRMFLEYIRALSSSLTSSVLRDLRATKTQAKESIASVDAELKRRTREVLNLQQGLEKGEQAFAKGQAEIKRMHAKVIEPEYSSPAFSWSPVRPDDKDKQFERIQKLVSEQSRIASDGEFAYSQLVSMHMSAYSRASTIVGDLGSLRRQMNRNIVRTVRHISPQILSEMKKISENSIPQFQKKLEEMTPEKSDFGMRLGSLDASLTSLVGIDRERRISEMKTANESEFIEYRAVQSYIAKQQGELSFSRSERIEVVRKESSGWWFGRNSQGQSGYFPSVLVSQRPAGAALPAQHSPALSYRPPLNQFTPSATWSSASSADDRCTLIKQAPPFSFVGIVQFPYIGESVAVEDREVVDIERMASNKEVIVRTSRGQIGTVPLKILTVKRRKQIQNQENLSGLINWSSFT